MASLPQHGSRFNVNVVAVIFLQTGLNCSWENTADTGLMRMFVEMMRGVFRLSLGYGNLRNLWPEKLCGPKCSSYANQQVHVRIDAERVGFIHSLIQMENKISLLKRVRLLYNDDADD